jgi:molybdopterin molybdotransferase
MKQIHLFDEAKRAAMNRTVLQRTETVDLSVAFGRCLAEDVIAKLNVPPFNRAMMDGFAIRTSDLGENGGTLLVVGTIIAGDEPCQSVEPGLAIRIMTGAPVPPGADAVVRFEWCEELSDNHVQVLKRVKQGESIQCIGEDGQSGQTVIQSGVRLSGAELAVCKTFGVYAPLVAIPPRICILVTGNELVQEPKTILRTGQIYGANEMFLQGALTEDGAVVTRVEYIRDDLLQIRNAISKNAMENDYVILTGGISAGDLDFVPAAIRDLSGDLDVEKVLMRPGSPFVVSKLGQSTIFALSGNPAASFIQFETLVRPVIRKTLGMEDKGFPITGELTHSVYLKPIKHTRILRAAAKIEDGKIVLDASLAQSPGVMSSFASANCLVRLDKSSYEAGEKLPVRLFKPLLY